jgi:hypothetical protein
VSEGRQEEGGGRLEELGSALEGGVSGLGTLLGWIEGDVSW